MEKTEKKQTNETRKDIKPSKKPTVSKDLKQIQKKKVQEKPFSGEKQKRPLKQQGQEAKQNVVSKKTVKEEEKPL